MGVACVCCYATDADKELSWALQAELDSRCITYGSRGFCDRESPSGCCQHLKIQYQYNPGNGKKEKLGRHYKH